MPNTVELCIDRFLTVKFYTSIPAFQMSPERPLNKQPSGALLVVVNYSLHPRRRALFIFALGSAHNRTCSHDLSFFVEFCVCCHRSINTHQQHCSRLADSLFVDGAITHTSHRYLSLILSQDAYIFLRFKYPNSGLHIMLNIKKYKYLRSELINIYNQINSHISFRVKTIRAKSVPRIFVQNE